VNLTKNLLVPKQIYFCAALFWSGIILVSCLIKSNEIPQIEIPYIDKVIHSFFYFVFTLLWFLYFKKIFNNSNSSKPLVVSFVFSLFFGIGIELLQQFVTDTRKADVIDVLANMTGATLTVVVIVLINKNSRIIDKI
jgi:VanZ family protein